MEGEDKRKEKGRARLACKIPTLNDPAPTAGKGSFPWMDVHWADPPPLEQGRLSQCVVCEASASVAESLKEPIEHGDSWGEGGMCYEKLHF